MTCRWADFHCRLFLWTTEWDHQIEFNQNSLEMTLIWRVDNAMVLSVYNTDVLLLYYSVRWVFSDRPLQTVLIYQQKLMAGVCLYRGSDWRSTWGVTDIHCSSDSGLWGLQRLVVLVWGESSRGRWNPTAVTELSRDELWTRGRDDLRDLYTRFCFFISAACLNKHCCYYCSCLSFLRPQSVCYT